MISLHTDHYFCIGHSHLGAGKPCQDYATSGVYEKVAYASVSDGCSSGGETDIGARMVALATASAIQEHTLKSDMIVSNEDVVLFSVYDIKAERRAVLRSAAGLFNLKDADLLATSLFGYVTQHASTIHIEGDGVLALQYGDGTVRLYRFDWPLNMPFYPIYRGASLKRFIEAHGGDIHAPCVKEEEWIIKPGHSVNGPTLHHYTLQTGLSGITMSSFLDPALFKDVSFIALFSDGITQIEGVDWKEAAMNFLAFKSVTGEFLKRRMIRGVKEFENAGKRPIDDISCAIIRIEHGEAETEGEET